MVCTMNTQLESKIEKSPGGCWLWLAYRDRHGYGKVNYGGRPPQGRVHFAHRLIYQLERGPIPEGKVLDHVCKNPGCVNPDHLEIVTQGENVRRGWEGRKPNACRRGHPLSGDNLRVNGRTGVRVCRACHRIREADRRRRGEHGGTAQR